MTSVPSDLKVQNIDGDFHSLEFLLPVIEQFDTFLEGDFEIEPFESFSADFSSAYWYTKYHLLLHKKVDVDASLKSLFAGKKINVIWLCITDGKTFSIKCIDGGKWILETLLPNDKLKTLIKLSD